MPKDQAMTTLGGPIALMKVLLHSWVAAWVAGFHVKTSASFRSCARRTPRRSSSTAHARPGAGNRSESMRRRRRIRRLMPFIEPYWLLSGPGTANLRGQCLHAERPGRKSPEPSAEPSTPWSFGCVFLCFVLSMVLVRGRAAVP